MPRSPPAPQWPIAMVLTLAAMGCGIRLTACESMGDPLPAKLWSCNTIGEECEIYARFKTPMDCEMYRWVLGKECDPKQPPGHLRCWPATSPVYAQTWFSKCTNGTITYESVRDGGTWVE